MQIKEVCETLQPEIYTPKKTVNNVLPKTTVSAHTQTAASPTN
jgi:hypothetical protein